MSETLSWPHILGSLLESADLSVSEATWAMEQVMEGTATPAQVAGLLVALRAKGETVDEIVGFRDAILDHAVPLDVDPMALDIVGTGGDRFGTVNISSTASIIAAAAGTPVIKHGNRAASSSSGSSDVLAALGVDLTLTSERVAEAFRRTGIAFVFAAMFHPGFRHAGAVRAELGVPTVFNLLGPLCNPARPEASAVGVAHLDRVPLFVGVFQTRGATALVFRGDDGLDELTTTGHSHIWEVSRGSVVEHDLDPRDLGIRRAGIDELRGRDAAYNASVVRAVLGGEEGAVRDIVLLNAAAGLISFDLARDPSLIRTPILDRFRSAMARAAEAIDSGAAIAKLDEWVQETRRVD
ncbi:MULTISPECIES: anthranilate phosphoribosyltransferase [unclassified Rathayibacter]|uniref:anthranilate phosphoribosyltransferase n=1 Tax=unclassified Rathayibacter TaxID=2609250 RepID=UPI00070110D3|nr:MULTISPECIES: anthranilate phosphoribosyltransferase [unclassified Rathayibacter]KQQ01452.1 anthranilate phosphoribosyltransferase [Rathayibacter sp. Leaf294]KQS11484.1 anthranilate phosphoribosyltransferase [Rathayibacter sp. Leaf185]